MDFFIDNADLSVSGLSDLDLSPDEHPAQTDSLAEPEPASSPLPRERDDGLPSKRDLFDSQYTWEPLDPKALTGFDVRTRFGFYTLLAGRTGDPIPSTTTSPSASLISSPLLDPFPSASAP